MAGFGGDIGSPQSLQDIVYRWWCIACYRLLGHDVLWGIYGVREGLGVIPVAPVDVEKE